MSAATSDSVSTPKSSLWKLPGLDKDTFYAAALFLSVAKGNVNAGRHYREPKTSEDIRDFLDHLADCFARSKDQDRRDHVSATAMVRNEKRKTITLYIAKNQSERRPGPAGSLEKGVIKNENDDFAKRLIEWFNRLGGEDAAQSDHDDLRDQSTIFKTMCDFNRSRIEHYIDEIGKADIDALDNDVVACLSSNPDARPLGGWEKAKGVITKCQDYKVSTNDSETPSEQDSLLTCAKLAGKARENVDFLRFASVVDTLPEIKRVKVKKLTYVLGGIKYLGRLFAAYKQFRKFCNTESRNGFSFAYDLLVSSDCEWDGDTYWQKFESWAEILQLSEVQKSADGEAGPDIKKQMSDIVKKNNNKAPVHCEMRLLMHFSGPDAEKCENYFGCSKKSCWLCWQMILKNSRYTMKDTHRKIYPAWVFPFDYSASQPAIAEGLITAYNSMLSLVQESLIKRTSLTFIEPLVQSSFRMTPAYRPSPSNPNLDGSAISKQFPEPLITVPGKFHAHIVRALHLPEYGSSTFFRMVEVHAYEKVAGSQRTLPTIVSQRFDNKRIFLDFQLRTHPKSLSLDSEIEEYQQALWEVAHFGFYRQSLSWSIFFRTAYETLYPNPYISSLCAKTQPEIPQPIPWRGDVFIFQDRISGRGIDMRSESPFNEVACLQGLEYTLRKYSEKWDPDKAAKEELEIASDGLEEHKNQLRRRAVYERIERFTSEDELNKLAQRHVELTRELEEARRKRTNREPSLSKFW